MNLGLFLNNLWDELTYKTPMPLPRFEVVNPLRDIKDKLKEPVEIFYIDDNEPKRMVGMINWDISRYCEDSIHVWTNPDEVGGYNYNLLLELYEEKKGELSALKLIRDLEGRILYENKRLDGRYPLDKTKWEKVKSEFDPIPIRLSNKQPVLYEEAALQKNS